MVLFSPWESKNSDLVGVRIYEVGVSLTQLSWGL